ncbi:MAG: HD domain-containing protein [Lachnospiraceae bacterium]|nr:HD domain-containing protein [Lachnospiraceae bacterium]
MNQIFLEIQKQLKKALGERRFEHTKGVMYTAASLAMCHGISLNQAQLAGLLHDCAKAIPDIEKLERCKNYGIPISDVEKKNPSLLHAKLGAYLAREQYGVTDEEVLHAISVHTTGEPDMNILDKILFIADYIEPNRDRQPNLEEVRRIAFEDLDRALEKILYDTLKYLEHSNKKIDSMTKKTYDYYVAEGEVER